MKLFNGKEWLWFKVKVKGHGKARHLSGKQKSPLLVVKAKRFYLSMPVDVNVTKLDKNNLVCAVDMGIKHTAVASIVNSEGTVVQRKFFHLGADIDRRDKLFASIRAKASKTGRLSKGESQFTHTLSQLATPLTS